MRKISRNTAYPYPTMLLLVFVMGNLLILDAYIVYREYQRSLVLGESTDSACPQACIARMNQLSGVSAGSSAREYYIPLGSGSGYSKEWDDVSGVSAYINTASYGRIKSVSFEATSRIPAGGQRIWVRLFNATDLHPVWYSEVTTDDSQQTLLTSGPLTLDKGNKWYKVQLKTQLGVLTNITSARVKITTY